MWHITEAALAWCKGEIKDSGAEACRTCPARLAIFAAFERARGKHITSAPEPC